MTSVCTESSTHRTVTVELWWHGTRLVQSLSNAWVSPSPVFYNNFIRSEHYNLQKPSKRKAVLEWIVLCASLAGADCSAVVSWWWVRRLEKVPAASCSAMASAFRTRPAGCIDSLQRYGSDGHWICYQTTVWTGTSLSVCMFVCVCLSICLSICITELPVVLSGRVPDLVTGALRSHRRIRYRIPVSWSSLLSFILVWYRMSQ